MTALTLSSVTHTKKIPLECFKAVHKIPGMMRLVRSHISLKAREVSQPSTSYNITEMTVLVQEPWGKWVMPLEPKYDQPSSCSSVLPVLSEDRGIIISDPSVHTQYKTWPTSYNTFSKAPSPTGGTP